MNTLHGEKNGQYSSNCQVSHPLLIRKYDDDDDADEDNNKQTWTVRKPVQMGKIPIMKKWDQKIEEGIEKISKSTDYRGLLISPGFQYSLTFKHQEIQLNSQIQIAHVKCAHAYTSVISINISLINRLHTFLPKWRLTPSRNSNSFQNFTLPSKWSPEGTWEEAESRKMTTTRTTPLSHKCGNWSSYPNLTTKTLTPMS